jgi:hypothetical protein
MQEGLTYKKLEYKNGKYRGYVNNNDDWEGIGILKLSGG